MLNVRIFLGDIDQYRCRFVAFSCPLSVIRGTVQF
jgi:hypothetical protein